MSQDATLLKEKIVSLLALSGPSLPIIIAKEISSSTLFTSAFLSELVEEKRIKMSFMRVGSSPIYFLGGQESLLERFANNLKSKEKEAFLMLREKKFLIDSEQSPAIRVAVREIKDFAIPFQNAEDLIWRFVAVPETDFRIKEKQKTEAPVKKEVILIPASQELKPAKIRKKRKRLGSRSKNYDFFNKVKNFLSEKSIEVIEIKHVSKNEVVAIIKNPEPKLLVAYNKKKLTDSDIIRAAKKASEFKLPFKIYSHGDILKKT